MTLYFNANPITHRRCIIFFLFLAALTSCTNTPSSAIQPEDSFLYDSSQKVTFFVSTPPETPSEADIYLDIVDEITGINLNPDRHKMNLVAENLFSIEIPASNDTLLKYRYAMGSNPTTVEHNTIGIPVNYRVIAAQTNNTVVARDVVASWTEAPINVSLGRLEGKLVDSISGEGIPDILINLNGMQTITTETGEFLLSDALPGKYQLTLYSKDGLYGPFQQEAIIAPESSTPVELPLKAHPPVQIKFIVSPPTDHNPQAPIRLIGSTESTGNTFSIQPGSTTVIAVNAPVMELQDDGTYELSLSLPSGMDFRYKYTTGDGFWNAERLSDGQFITRQLIVPENDATIRESIAGWSAGDRIPITIIANQQPEANSPDQLYIQLNSYTWTAALPMWKSSTGGWLYEIYSPLYLFPSIGYRLCWDAQCTTPVQFDQSQNQENSRIPTDGSQTFIQLTIPPQSNIPD